MTAKIDQSDVYPGAVFVLPTTGQNMILGVLKSEYYALTRGQLVHLGDSARAAETLTRWCAMPQWMSEAWYAERQRRDAAADQEPT